MIVKYYNTQEAKKKYEKRLYESDFFLINLKDDGYIELREQLLKVYNELKDKFRGYSFDLAFALELHEIVNQKEWFSPVLAANYSFWKYFSLEVIPDIIFGRHGNIKEYYFNKNVRIYPATMYWYIHLFYQGSKEETFKFLNMKCFTTDTIMQTIERPGRKGLDIELYREILKQYSKIDENTARNKCGSYIHLLRKVMVQHTAKDVVLVPELYAGGIRGYVEMLFKIVLGG